MINRKTNQELRSDLDKCRVDLRTEDFSVLVTRLFRVKKNKCKSDICHILMRTSCKKCWTLFTKKKSWKRAISETTVDKTVTDFLETFIRLNSSEFYICADYKIKFMWNNRRCDSCTNIFSLTFLPCKENNFTLWFEQFFKTWSQRGSRNYVLRGCTLNKMGHDEEGECLANTYLLVLRYSEVCRNTIQEPDSWKLETAIFVLYVQSENSFMCASFEKSACT